MIIGLTGYARAGKDSVADHLMQNYDFKKYVFSDILSEVLQLLKMENTKENQSKLGVALRKASNQNIIGYMLAEKIKDQDNIVISGLRSPEEAKLFKKLFGARFNLIYLNRNFENRYQFRRNLDFSKEEFQVRDERDGEHMGLHQLIKEELFDLEVNNNFSKEELLQKIDNFVIQRKQELQFMPSDNQSVIHSTKSRIVERFLKDRDRPTWEQYFAIDAIMTGLRSPCKRLKVGAVIVSEEKRKLASGYNGYLPGQEHQSIIYNGHEINTIHGEINAIAQAAKAGIPIKGSTIYLTHNPCLSCLKTIAACGLKVKYLEDYKSSDNNAIKEFIEKNNVDMQKIDVTPILELLNLK